MNFLKKIFSRKEKPIKSNKDFWDWFVENEKVFHNVVNEHENIEKDFLDKLAPKLDQIREGIFYLTGMKNDLEAELILTPDGNLRNVGIVEELIKDAPNLSGWVFTALKPELKIEDTSIKMGGYEYTSKNLFFYSNNNKDYPDEIDLTIVYTKWSEENKRDVEVGVHIFLDNYLGELNFITNIDTINITGIVKDKKDLVPISKLKDFLKWRQKEFVEKYENVIYDSTGASCSILEFNFNDGDKGIAAVNTEILRWDNQASHPWICSIDINYDGKSNRGMPNEETQQKLEKVEDQIIVKLIESEGYINIGRTTAKSKRTIYFACKDFRKPSHVFHEVKNTFATKFEIEFDIYKDKYWRTFNKFIVN